jgi:hypothetical protein
MNNFNNFLNHLNSFNKKQQSIQEGGAGGAVVKSMANGAAAIGGAISGAYALGNAAGKKISSSMPDLSRSESDVQQETQEEEQKRREEVFAANPDLKSRMQEDPRNRPGIGMGIAQSMNDMSRKEYPLQYLKGKGKELPQAKTLGSLLPILPVTIQHAEDKVIDSGPMRPIPVKSKGSMNNINENTRRSIFLNHLNSFSK